MTLLNSTVSRKTAAEVSSHDDSIPNIVTLTFLSPYFKIGHKGSEKFRVRE